MQKLFIYHSTYATFTVTNGFRHKLNKLQLIGPTFWLLKIHMAFHARAFV